MLLILKRQPRKQCRHYLFVLIDTFVHTCRYVYSEQQGQSLEGYAPNTEMPARVLPPGLLDGRVCLLCSTWPRATRGGQPKGSLPGQSQITSVVGAPDGWTARPTLGSPPSRPSPLSGLAESFLQWSLCHLETPGCP